MTYHGINFDRDEISRFCRRHGIKRLSLFGSIVRQDFRPDSDIDVLVEFEPGQTPSLFDLGGMLMELQTKLGHEVDLKTPGFLSPRIHRQVAAEAQVQYAA
jgi:predicted nucleotidyltransferase